MEMYQELLVKLLSNGSLQAELPQPAADELIKDRCYTALRDIRDILRDDTLSDPECFMKIEKIVCALEDIGITSGSRHDF